MEEIRTYTPDDKEYIVNALIDEGLTEDEMTFETDETYLSDVGFFSYREGEYPQMTHFYVDKDKRGFDNARKLIRQFWKLMIEKGVLFYIMEIPKSKPYIARFAKYLKGNEYYKKDGNRYYYIPIGGRL